MIKFTALEVNRSHLNGKLTFYSGYYEKHLSSRGERNFLL